MHILRCGVQKSILDRASSREWEYHLGKVLLKKIKSLEVEYVYRCRYIGVGVGVGVVI